MIDWFQFLFVIICHGGDLLFTITGLNGASASADAGATGYWPPTYFCRVGHGVVHIWLSVGSALANVAFLSILAP